MCADVPVKRSSVRLYLFLSYNYKTMFPPVESHLEILLFELKNHACNIRYCWLCCPWNHTCDIDCHWDLLSVLWGKTENSSRVPTGQQIDGNLARVLQCNRYYDIRYIHCRPSNRDLLVRASSDNDGSFLCNSSMYCHLLHVTHLLWDGCQFNIWGN